MNLTKEEIIELTIDLHTQNKSKEYITGYIDGYNINLKVHLSGKSKRCENWIFKFKEEYNNTKNEPYIR